MYVMYGALIYSGHLSSLNCPIEHLSSDVRWICITYFRRSSVELVGPALVHLCKIVFFFFSVASQLASA